MTKQRFTPEFADEAVRLRGLPAMGPLSFAMLWAGARRHRLEADRLSLRERSDTRMAQDEEPDRIGTCRTGLAA
jgi:hypothetical protein